MSLVKSKPQLSLIKSEIVSQIKLKTVTSENDANNGDSVGYLMRRWEVSWRIGAVFVVIVTATEMHGVVEISLDADLAVS